MQNNTINGRTPEEIKRGLECCKPKWESGRWVTCRDECPFRNEHAFCKNVLMACILALLCRFEFERDEARNDLDTLNYANTELHSAYEAMKRERDAAVRDMRDATLCGCHVCKHYYRPDANVRIYACRKFGEFGKFDYIKDDGSMFCGAFEWRGVEVVN